MQTIYIFYAKFIDCLYTDYNYVWLLLKEPENNNNNMEQTNKKKNGKTTVKIM